MRSLTWQLFGPADVVDSHRLQSDGRKGDCNAHGLAIGLVEAVENDEAIFSHNRSHRDVIVAVCGKDDDAECLRGELLF